MREVSAVNEWLISNKSVHVMRDHPGHEMVMMGGLWATRLDTETRTQWRHTWVSVVSSGDLGTGHGQYNDDQVLLRDHVWSWAQHNVMQHDSYW